MEYRKPFFFFGMLIATIATRDVISQAPSNEAKPPPVGAVNSDLDKPKSAIESLATAKNLSPDELKAVANALKSVYDKSPPPEAVRMLIAIADGSQMGPGDGWFGPAQSRYSWEWLAQLHQIDPSNGISPESFRGQPELFPRLDRNKDGTIAADDLDWSDRNPYVQQSYIVNRIFRRLDQEGDGQVTRDELLAMFERLAGDKTSFRSEQLRDALIGGPSGFQPGDAPTPEVLVRGLFRGEIGSLNEGPKVGEPAPDFRLTTHDGSRTIRLSEQFGSKPVVLVFGNFTCGPFRSMYPMVDELCQRYQNEVTFLSIYVREAHPSDGWHMESNAKVGVKFSQPQTFAERTGVAQQCHAKLKYSMPLLVDEIHDPVGNAYSGMPARLYVIDTDGKVAYKGGRGPFGFKSGEMEQALLMLQLDRLSRSSDKNIPPSTVPDPVPLTRDDIKRVLDASKQTTPRLPLPPLTNEERVLIEEQKEKAAQAGEAPRRLGLANNGRMRAYYLSEYGFSLSTDLERARAGTTRGSDSSLDSSLRTMLFWIVSRGNNCTYCLGHQESGLASRGVTDDQLAALDGDWLEFEPAKRAAFTFAKKLSFESYAIRDEDIAALREHYDETQVADIIVAVAGFNSTNRWTGPLRIKQDVLFQFVRPTSPEYASKISRFAPVKSAAAGGLGPAVCRPRPELEGRAELEKSLALARKRTPRLKLASESETPTRLGDHVSKAPPLQWVRLLASQQKPNLDRIASHNAALEKGTLEPRTKAIIAYVCARHDRAWYALGHAIERLRSLGFTEDQIFALDRPEELAATADREIVRFATTITVDPALITDSDFARLRPLLDDKRVAEIVYQISDAAFFNRLTEAAGLQLEH